MKKLLVMFTALALTLSVVGCKKKEGESAAAPDPEKYSYAVGYQIGKNLKTMDIDLESSDFIDGFKDGMKGNDSDLSEEELQAAMSQIQIVQMQNRGKRAAENLKKGQEYLTNNKSNKGVSVTASGLQYKVIKQGTGAVPTANDIVKVHYKGTLIDGTEFDSSYKRKEPVEFPVNGVIPGWQEAVQLMKVGSTYEFVIPSNLAYGERGTPNIPGNSVLVFQIELLETKAAPAPAKK